MPGYEILGYTGSWLTDDAIHCRAMGVTDRYMLYIDHIPLERQPGRDEPLPRRGRPHRLQRRGTQDRFALRLLGDRRGARSSRQSS